MAAAAWSWVEKMLHEVQVISAPRALRVSMRTAVWMAIESSAAYDETHLSHHDHLLMCKQPAMRAPFSGWSWAYFSRVAMRPGISCSASSISRRPKAARLMSATCRTPSQYTDDFHTATFSRCWRTLKDPAGAAIVTVFVGEDKI